MWRAIVLMCSPVRIVRRDSWLKTNAMKRKRQLSRVERVWRCARPYERPLAEESVRRADAEVQVQKIPGSRSYRLAKVLRAQLASQGLHRAPYRIVPMARRRD